MIELTLKISDKENGTPGEVCELIQWAIENVEGHGNGYRFEVESAKAKRVK
jgi:hypothetical protein